MMSLQDSIALILIIAVFGAFAWLSFLSRKKAGSGKEPQKK